MNTAFQLQLPPRLERIKTDKSPIDPPPKGWLGRNAHWVKPRLVAEVEFTEWTADGKIRHPSFQGLRRDKPAETVVREGSVRRTPSTPRASRSTPSRDADRIPVRTIGISHPDRVMYEQPRL